MAIFKNIVWVKLAMLEFQNTTLVVQVHPFEKTQVE